ncbi:probable multidrug resistance-associated protein lethal(2)03659 [Bacillus rossius redtenbacheri]|uniref:probable multidrug resistance-associated protein lethal(2)03659 n=1 Tax=Bacillus rossius redtenbacheri TaxID=93214 RepID=UPI002FDD4061
MESPKKVKRPDNPRASANFLNVYFFIWVWKIFKRGMRKEFDIDDLFVPLEEHKSDYLGDKFESAWRQEVADRKKPSLLRVLMRCYFWEYTLYCLPVVIMEMVFRVAQPLFLGQLIQYFEAGSGITLRDAYLHALGVLVCTASFFFVRQPYMMAMFHMGMKMRVGICSLIYRKALRLTQTAFGETTVGQVVNLLSNDVSRFESCLTHPVYLWLGPVQAVVITYFMWTTMGSAAVIGVVATLGFIPLQGYIGKKVGAQRVRCANKTDKRVCLMNEIITGIQVIKLYTWEIPFVKLVSQARRDEIKEIRVSSYLRAMVFSFEWFTTRLTLFITVLLYVMMGNNVTAEKVFVAACYFNLLKTSMTDFFPRAISMVAETLVSIKRVENFLYCEELPAAGGQADVREGKCDDGGLENDKLVGEDERGVALEVLDDGSEDPESGKEPLGVTITNATAKWQPGSGESTLTGISLKVIPGRLLAVIGPVGSGKTSLLHAILRELPLTSGSIAVRGEVSYASQEPWLFAGSVRDNILFGQPYDWQRYRQVVKVCALARDFQLFPYGDLTEVGERGVAISGGQKARINLARAVYKRADIYILDDPLSAVDTHVGKHLFESCICGYLRNKTCVLVTHQLQFLGDVDQIVILKDGRVEADGTFSELQQSGLDFAKLLGDGRPAPADDDEDAARIVAVVRRKKETSIGSSTSSLGLAFTEKEAPERAREMQTQGKIRLATYGSYLFASRSCCLVSVVFAANLVAQLLTSGSDYWFSFWADIESKRALRSQPVAGNVTNATKTGGTANSTFSDAPADDSLLSRDLCVYIFTALTFVTIGFILLKIFLFMHLCMLSSVHLHNNMFTKIIHLPMKFFNVNPSGQILNRFSKDMGTIDEQMPIVMLDCLTISFAIVGIVALVAWVNYWILVPTALIVVVFYLLRIVYVRTSRSVKRLEGITRSPVFSHLNASIQGLTTIRAFKAEKMLQDEFDRHQDLHSTAFYLFIASNRGFGLWLDIVCLFYIACVTFSFLVFGQVMFGGDVGLAITQSLALTGMFQWGMRQSGELENQMTSVERVLEYSGLQEETEVISSSEKLPPKDWPSAGKIVFKNVYLSYSPDEPAVLKNLSFTINPSEKIGIVGRTGAGKSSLISALFLLTRIEGSIVIDDVDTKSIRLHVLRSKISIIPQEPVLFSGSLRKNLDPFHEYPDSVLWSALEEVELKEAVSDLPARLDHLMMEGGLNFSVGQRQLVCLARAIIRNNRILVMDEATANVDPRTDTLIQETVRRKFADCTVLTIAHRLQTVMDSDRILVMDAGNAVEFDHPHALLQSKKGFLWDMVHEAGPAAADALLRVAEAHHSSQNEETS